MLGAEYIETGEASAPNVPDSGKDPVIVSIAVKLPIWGSVYAAEENEARAESAALRAREQAARNTADAELAKSLSEVRDSTRRVKLYRDTLVPQAEAVFGSVLGGYQTGESSVASTLLAQRELLEIQLAQFRAQADHGVALARLEAVVGRPIRVQEVG